MLIGVIFYRGLQLGLVDSVGPRIQYHAMPMAVSVLYHGHPHDYTALRTVAHPFQGPDSVNHYLESAVQQKIEQRDIYFWVADDKGSGDYVIAAFTLFGAKIRSLYLFWFICLLITTGLFMNGFKHHLWCLGLLGLVLIGIYTAVSTLPLANEAFFLNSASSGAKPLSAVGIYEARFFDVLAMIAVIHMCLFALRKSWVASGWQIAVFFGQVAFFFFLYHARSSLGWQLVAVVVFLLLIVTFRLWRCRKKNVNKLSRFVQPFFVIATLLVALILLTLYKHATYNPRYFQDMGVRTFWHNALMGVSQRKLAQTYKLSVSDFDAAAAVIKYSGQGTCADSVTKLEPQELLNSLGGHGEQDWVAYEDCAKNLYFNLWYEHGYLMAHNYVVIKPQEVLNFFLGVSRTVVGNSADTVRERLAIGWHPLTGVPLAFAVVILSVVNRSLYRRIGPYFALLTILLLTSLIPSLFFYSAVLTLGGFAVTLSIFCYVLIWVLATSGFNRWLYVAAYR